jgi:hypothetical protein
MHITSATCNVRRASQRLATRTFKTNPTQIVLGRSNRNFSYPLMSSEENDSSITLTSEVLGVRWTIFVDTFPSENLELGNDHFGRGSE